MSCLNLRGRWHGKMLAGLTILGLAGVTGCQVQVGGQTLPSPWWHYDDVQYFPPGNEFKLSREAAAMKAASAEQIPLGEPDADGADAAPDDAGPDANAP